MATSLYVASAEGRSGKSAVALGLLDRLSRRVGRVGVFRPIVRDVDPAADHVLDLLLSRLPEGSLAPRDAAGVGYDDVHRDPEAAMAAVVERYHAVADRCDAVLVVGSDYTDVASPTEFAWNATLAANLGTPMVLVVAGSGRTPEQVATAAAVTLDDARAHHARVLAVVANRVDPGSAAAVGERLARADGPPSYVVPSDVVLDSPTVRELAAAVDGELLVGDDPLLDREATGLVVAAMTMPNVLERLVEGCLVVAPGDRADVLLGLLLAHRSATFPTPSGIVLNGGLELPATVGRLVEGLEVHVPSCAARPGRWRPRRRCPR